MILVNIKFECLLLPSTRLNALKNRYLLRGYRYEKRQLIFR